MKLESRGKYPGVKIHLDAEECEKLLSIIDESGTVPGASCHSGKKAFTAVTFSARLGVEIRKLLKEEPELLQERTPEQIAAILAKESDKAKLQLEAMKAGASWQKVDPAKLQVALNKHVKF